MVVSAVLLFINPLTISFAVIVGAPWKIIGSVFGMVELIKIGLTYLTL